MDTWDIVRTFAIDFAKTRDAGDGALRYMLYHTTSSEMMDLCMSDCDKLTEENVIDYVINNI